jgi:entericidin B
MNCVKHRVGIVSAVALACAAMIGVAGCNTIEGVGKDLSGAGQGLADIAADVNPENN